jgi:hypothetical protein
LIFQIHYINLQGKYFIGQTPTLFVSNISNAWAALVKPDHKVLLQYVQSTGGIPSDGVNILDHIVPPYTTLVSEEDGKIIIPTGGNVLLFLKSSSIKIINTIIAYGWWETREE